MPNPAKQSMLCNFPKYVCRNPVNLCCNGDHDPFVRKWSPIEKCSMRSTCHPGCSFHNDRPTHPGPLTFASQKRPFAYIFPPEYCVFWLKIYELRSVWKHVPELSVLCNLYNSARSKKASFANQSLDKAISRALAVSRNLPTPDISLRRRGVVIRKQVTFRSRTGMFDPQNRCSFPFDRATDPAKKRGCWTTPKLTGQNLCKIVK